MNNKKRLTKFAFIGLIFCILVSLIVIGCGETTPPTSTPTVTKPAGPVSGGILRVAFYADSQSLGNPPDLKSLTELRLNNVCLETLGRDDVSGKLQPWLALDFKEDHVAKTITMPLRKGVKFHDGTDFNAEAIKWNIELWKAAKRLEVASIASVDVIDEYTVRLNLNKWDNTASQTIGTYINPVSPTAYKTNGKDWALKNPVGTGPFQFVSWQRDVKQVYKKFPGYWQQGKPYLDGIEFVTIADTMVATTAFKAKEVDVFCSIPTQFAREIETAGIATIAKPSGNGAGIAGVIGDSGHANSPFSNIKVRQAMSHAIDSKAIVNNVLYGYAVPTNQWGLPAMWSYNTNVKGYPYDPSKAKQLLAEAGYPNGFTTKFPILNASSTPQVMTAVQGYLKAVGISATIDLLDMAKIIQLQTQTGWEGLTNWQGKSYADLANWAPRHLSKKGYLYSVGLDHPDKLEKLMDDATAATTFESKKVLCQQMQAMIIDEYTLITPLYIVGELVAKYPYIQDDGFNVTQSLDWTPDKVWIKK